MKTKALALICCTTCLLITLASCRDHGILSDDFQAGDTVTPEELLEISRELFTETSEPLTETKEASSVTEVATESSESTEPVTLAPDATVYWLLGGSVYHADKTCYHISRTDLENIKEGTVPEAEADGKERLCASCAP